MDKVSLLEAPSTELVAHSMIPPDGAIGTVAMVTREEVKTQTMLSWFATDYSWVPPGQRVAKVVIQGNLLAMQRNECVHRFVGDWILFIDDDMVWDPDAVGKLVAARDEIDADIIGGLCFQRGEPHQPTLYMREAPTSGGYVFLEEWDSDIVEVDATGMAFCLIHKRVFERISGVPTPSLEERDKLGMPNFFRWEGRLGEDLRFCQDAKASGCRVFVDTRIEIGHIAEVEIRKRHFLMQVAQREKEIDEGRQELLGRMGLPHLTSDEVRRRLGWSE